MNILINCLKPPGMTSHDVVSYLRKVLQTKKIGHSGTLDPAVPGVLLLGVGKGTKVLEYLTESDKQYRCEMILGIVTDTQDTTGEVTDKSSENVSDDDIHAVFRNFTGEIMQVPPIYSAVKYQGKPLYKLARQGKKVDMPQRSANIHQLDIIRIERADKHTKILFDVTCSKGTYIRTLCHDIGQELGCGAAMSYLIRTRSGAFHINEAITLEGLDKNSIAKYALPIDAAVKDMPKFSVPEADLKAISNGVAITVDRDSFSIDELTVTKSIRVYDHDNAFLGLGKFQNKDNNIFLKMTKFLG